MSEVISFRLDSNNPREAEALAVLTSHQERGYSTRQILTEALLKYAQADTSQDIRAQLAAILSVMHRVGEQIEHLQLTEALHTETHIDKQAVLSNAFVVSIKNAARPGITL